LSPRVVRKGGRTRNKRGSSFSYADREDGLYTIDQIASCQGQPASPRLEAQGSWITTAQFSWRLFITGLQPNRSISTTISKTAKERNMSQPINTPVTILRRVQVQARTGLSRSSIYKLMQEGDFPKQVSLGPRAVGWRRGDIDQWLESRPVKS
jgi:prophage regulatory protein